MPTLKVYQNGVSAYTGGTGDHKRSPRGEVVGWSLAAARRQTRWLWSVDAPGLTGSGWAVTLTLAETPPDAVTWHRLRKAWLMRVQRAGAIRVHWVVEWQARGTPHLHAAVYFEQPLSRLEAEELAGYAWLEIARPYGASWRGQDVHEITGPVGWLKYLSKHAARGARHYQRQGHPEGWEKTGRLWGYAGEWPVFEPMELEGLNSLEFYRTRRILRAWARSDARKAGDWKRLSYLRHKGRPNEEFKSRYQGVSEWIPEAVMLRLVDYFERE